MVKKEFFARVLYGLYSRYPSRSGLRKNFEIHESLAIYDLLFIFSDLYITGTDWTVVVVPGIPDEKFFLPR
jgi:hypothetical protein